jgi:hypothetical protein
MGALAGVVGALVCTTAPLYGVDGDGSASGTLVEVNGRGALVPVALFVLLGLGGWLAPTRRLRAVLVLGHTVLTVLSLLSIGMFFLPATLLLVSGAVLDARGARSRAVRSEPLVPTA